MASLSSPYIISKSTMSRSCIVPPTSSSRQEAMAFKVIGLSHKPLSITVFPASIRFAMAISPSRERSSTAPISRRYIRTGSSERLNSFSSKFPLSSMSSSCSRSSFSFSKSSVSDSEIRLIPKSEIEAIMSSMFSEVSFSEGRALFNSSTVM